MNHQLKNPNLRRAQIILSGQWTDVEASEIKKGMVFRIFEPDGTPVSCNGKTEFIAAQDTYFNKDKIAVTMVDN